MADALACASFPNDIYPEFWPLPQKFGVEVQSHGGSPAQVFAAFFKPQTRNFHQTKSSSRALETVGFHLKRLAVRREAERVEGRSPRSLSFAISLWNDKEMASKPTQRARVAVRARRKSC